MVEVTGPLAIGSTIFTERQPASTELGTIHVFEEAGRSCAYWSAGGDETPMFLCSIATAAYNNKSELRQAFMALAAATAGHGEHAVAIGKKVEPPPPAPWWADLVCARCTAPQAADIRHRCAQVTELAELETSPSGLPLGCCKLRVVGQMNSDPSMSRPR